MSEQAQAMLDQRINELIEYLDANSWSVMELLMATLAITRAAFLDRFYRHLSAEEREAFADRVAKAYDLVVECMNSLPTQSLAEDGLIVFDLLEEIARLASQPEPPGEEDASHDGRGQAGS